MQTHEKRMRMRDVLEHEDSEYYYITRAVIIAECSHRKAMMLKLAEHEIEIPLTATIHMHDADSFRIVILTKLLGKGISMEKAQLISGLMSQELTLIKPQVAVAEA